jgi:ssDNA-binding Zn-finger/Zn-ribbon topoisomerase 1
VEAACGNCPANVLAREHRRTLAACYGTVVCPWSSESFHAAVDGAVERDRGAGDLVPRTTPAWYGLWIGSPLEGERAEATARILEAVEAAEPDAATGLGELALALHVAVERGLRVQVAAYPEGSADAGVFAISPHCPNCKMTWRLKQGRGVCPACGYEGFAAPLKKRRARGSRPYFPLAKLLGEPGAREFLSRYAADRAQ